MIDESKQTERVLVEVDGVFAPHVAAALTRLAYLYPEVPFDYREKKIFADCPDAQLAVLRRDAAYALYRERIASETHGIRQQLFSKIFSSQ